MEFMGSPWMTTFSLIVAITNPPAPVAAPSRVSSAISRPYEHLTAPQTGRVLFPPESRRAEFNGSGAPSWTAAQGCAVCGDPSDPMKEARESAKRTACRGKRPVVTLGLSKVTRPGPKGGRNPGPRILWGKATSRALLCNALRRQLLHGDSLPPATDL